MRSSKVFPIDNPLCSFLKSAWEKGWLDEYSNEHFLIKSIENRLKNFVGMDQLVMNDLNLHGVINNGILRYESFNINFCINLSMKLEFMSKVFGEKQIKNFIVNQMSAGKKKNYNEDTFLQSLSEISILLFYASKFRWNEVVYEPPVSVGTNNKNPEAKFIGTLFCNTDSNSGVKSKTKIIVNVEVKSPQFPHNKHNDERILIPTVLLTDQGRVEIPEFCNKFNVKYLNPRVHKLKDFINSATEKFSFPQENEFNILYINWSYRDFPSNSFLEAWSLLTNDINGILTNEQIGLELGVNPDAYKKITAVVVYTDSLEGLMFSDLRYVWQRNGVGTRFRMWVLNEKLINSEQQNNSNILFYITGMNPSKPDKTFLMLDYKAKSSEEKIESLYFAVKVKNLIDKNAIGKMPESPT